MIEIKIERLEQIPDGSLSIDQLLQELELDSIEELVKKFKPLSIEASRKWFKKLVEADFWQYRPLIFNNMDPRLAKAVLFAELGANSEAELLDKLSEMGEDNSKIWQSKIHFSDYAVLRGRMGGIKYDREQGLKNQDSGIMEAVLASVGLSATMLGAEGMKRLYELIKGSETNYYAEINPQKLAAAINFELNPPGGKKREIQLNAKDEDGVIKIYFGEALAIKIEIDNTIKTGPDDAQPFDKFGTFLEATCVVKISRTNTMLAGAHGVGAIGSALGSIAALQQKDLESFVSEILGVVKEGSESINIVLLHTKIAGIVTKLAFDAEMKQTKTKQDNRARNRTEFESLKNDKICESCGVLRDYERNTCGNCGKEYKPLNIQDPTKRDEMIEKFRKVELTF